MQIMRISYKILSVLLVGICMSACDNDIKDIVKPEEKLELTASSHEIALDLDNLREFVLTFDWTKARETSDEGLVFYTTKLDVVGNNFGTATAIINIEEEDVFSRSFTSEQLYNWMTERWGVPLTRPLILEFRVVAQWEGGPVFEAPEVRTVTVHVAAVKEEVPVADMIALLGSAVDNEMIEIHQTLENESKYAALLDLKAGNLSVGIVESGDMKYLSPVDGEGTLQDGMPEDVALQERRIAWNIETAGEYRIVVNLEDSKVTIYSPAKALEPAVVTWITNEDPQVEMHTIVTDLWMFGGGTSWGWWKGNCSVSLADPQVLIYQGQALSSGDGVKFVVYGESDFRNVAYAFTNPLTPDGKRQNSSLAFDKVGELHGGYDGETRNSYYRLPAGTNFIVFDLRNKTILAKKK
ncbi:MAG: SusE domain-containing protein [Fermentimonas sp.]|nr:SusE domain-containing protein [Fermentimonas sp.]MDD4696343.1 SusE domain-containing protein [Fermentimonas sp.]